MHSVEETRGDSRQWAEVKYPQLHLRTLFGYELFKRTAVHAFQGAASDMSDAYQVSVADDQRASTVRDWPWLAPVSRLSRVLTLYRTAAVHAAVRIQFQ